MDRTLKIQIILPSKLDEPLQKDLDTIIQLIIKFLNRHHNTFKKYVENEQFAIYSKYRSIGSFKKNLASKVTGDNELIVTRYLLVPTEEAKKELGNSYPDFDETKKYLVMIFIDALFRHGTSSN